MKFPEYTIELRADLGLNPLNTWWYYEVAAGGPSAGSVMYVSGQNLLHGLLMTDVPIDGQGPKYITIGYLLSQDSPFLYLGRDLDWLLDGKAGYGDQVFDIEPLRNEVVLKVNGGCLNIWWREFLRHAEAPTKPEPLKTRTIWDRLK